MSSRIARSARGGPRFARGIGRRYASPGGAPFGRGVTLAMVWVLALAFGSTGVAAQQPVPEALSFEDAVRVALERSPAFLQQLNAVERAEYAERASLGGFLPNLNASLGFGANISRTQTAEDDFGRPIGGAEFVESTRSSASQVLNGSYSLFDLQQIRDYGAARASTAVQEAAVESQAATLRRQVGQAYFGAVRQARLVEVEERQLQTARENLEAVRALMRLAAKQPTDVLGAELDVAQAELLVRQARGEAEKAKLVLKQNMGTPMSVEFELTGDFPAVFDPSGLDPAGLVARAARENPSLAQQAASVDAAERGLSAARAARFPSLGGNYSYGRNTSLQDYDALGKFDLPNSWWGFGVNVSVPLFNRFQTSSQIGQAGIEVDNAREALRQEQLQLEQEVLSARIDLDNAHAGVQVAQRSVEIARERLDQGQELYRQGTLDYTALQQMINALANAERGLVNARSQFATALLVLEEKVGGPVRQ
ncbi:MAG: TolC family protein [Gemmatimonadetes bacterium]|nr:TolC family protein [Gemmatimonadota bacterium]